MNLAGKRFCYYVDETFYVQDHGFRPSIVIEGEKGHYPTGTWPYNGKVGETMPYFWGHDIAGARKACDAANAQLGVSREDALKIVISSMFGTAS